MISRASTLHDLDHLARLYHVKTAYIDANGIRQEPQAEVIFRVLQSLRAPVERMEDAGDALRQRRQQSWRRVVEPVHVAWEGKGGKVTVRLPETENARELHGVLSLESGQEMPIHWQPAQTPVFLRAQIEGVRYVAQQFRLPDGLPHGYHHLKLNTSAGLMDTLVIAAPRITYTPPDGQAHIWGVFLPLYAMHSRRSWGAGDLGDLERVTKWVSELGGSVVATLPMLAGFLHGQPFDYSPYAPASRLFWNEFYLDMDSLLNRDAPGCAPAIEAAGSSHIQEQLASHRQAQFTDYRQQMATKRLVLQLLAEQCANRPDIAEGMQDLLRHNPELDQYSRFRAVTEQRQQSWHFWPDSLKSGSLQQGDYDEAKAQYHTFVQWAMSGQFARLSAKSASGGGLYLDLPIGVHPDGYDVWRNQRIFARGASAGAPPDIMFSLGQDWGFPPLHPDESRMQHHAHFIQVIQHHMRHASILRLDHVMGLHRLYWVPWGMRASEGTYVRYQPEEMYAILALESHRNRTVVVGEDLGTVPQAVRNAMDRHGLKRMYIGQFSLSMNYADAVQKVPPGAIASMNTHDMSLFQTFWLGLDIDRRLGMGLLTHIQADEARREREETRRCLVTYLYDRGLLRGSGQDPREVLKAMLRLMSASEAYLVLVNLEDLWLETEPQNVPGTTTEMPNWLRKARYTVDEMMDMPDVVTSVLQELGRIRAAVGKS